MEEKASCVGLLLITKKTASKLSVKKLTKCKTVTIARDLKNQFPPLNCLKRQLEMIYMSEALQLQGRRDDCMVSLEKKSFSNIQFFSTDPDKKQGFQSVKRHRFRIGYETYPRLLSA